jgi:hypothetical protein
LTQHVAGITLEAARGSARHVSDDHDYQLPTLDEIIERLAQFTPEQRSLAWSPQPPFESLGGSDCRMGGNCGLDFNYQTRRARWLQARYRYRKHTREHNP